MNDEIIARIERLERTNRRYRRALLAMAAGIVAIGSLAFEQGIPDVVRARRFEVVDSSGASLTELGSDIVGGRVTVRRREGGGALLFTNSDGGALGLINAEGHVPFRAGLSPKGGLMVITNERDQFAVMAAADDSSAGAMVLYDRNGQELWHAP
jgi:hypothetical protein